MIIHGHSWAFMGIYVFILTYIYQMLLNTMIPQMSNLSVGVPYLMGFCAQFYFGTIDKDDFRLQLSFQFKNPFHKQAY